MAWYPFEMDSGGDWRRIPLEPFIDWKMRMAEVLREVIKQQRVPERKLELT